VRVWNTANGRCLHTLEGHSWWVKSVGFNPDGNTIISASSDETIRVWGKDKKGWKCVRIFGTHTGEVNSARYSPDSNYIVSASDDNTTKVWNLLSITQRILAFSMSMKGPASLPFNVSYDQLHGISVNMLNPPKPPTPVPTDEEYSDDSDSD